MCRFYGPMSFDIGMLLGNLIMSYFSQSFHQNSPDFSQWILSLCTTLFSNFKEKFLLLWQKSIILGTGELNLSCSLVDSDAISEYQNNFFIEIWKDTLGYAGVEMIRRIVGVAHVADLESISDIQHRSVSEKRSLSVARKLLLVSNNSPLVDISLPSEESLKDLLEKTSNNNMDF